MIIFYVMIQFKAYTVESESDFLDQCNGHFLLLINAKSTGIFAPSTARGRGGALSQVANFENRLFGPNSIFNIRKRYKISGGKAL